VIVLFSNFHYLSIKFFLMMCTSLWRWYIILQEKLFYVDSIKCYTLGKISKYMRNYEILASMTWEEIVQTMNVFFYSVSSWHHSFSIITNPQLRIAVAVSLFSVWYKCIICTIVTMFIMHHYNFCSLFIFRFNKTL
jgi:hypothetical protein